MNLPFFSIVIPVYNRELLLAHVLQAVQQQLFTSFEVVIVDDGSTDKTARVVHDIAIKDERIKYYYKKNEERGAARNYGIKVSRGRYVVFLDSDDMVLPGYLSGLHDLIMHNPKQVIYAAKFLLKERQQLKKTDVASMNPGLYDMKFVLKGNPFACNFCIDKEANDIILFNEDRNLSTMEDWIFLIQNLTKHPLVLGDFIGLHMVEHEGRSMQQNQLLIERRIKASRFVEATVPLADAEKKELWGYTYYFCGVHSYIDSRRKQSFQFIKKAANLIGYTKKLRLLFVKVVIGKSTINKFKFFS